ncbi:MAG TPA: hypothetical protein VNL16_02000 [Chloroflexota bacterium]|nr:hypothetical protein [Chloroflexota bacterium]
MTRLVRLGEVATITQGMSVTGGDRDPRRPCEGARHGDWQVQAVGVGDVQDDRLVLEWLRTVDLARNVKTEKHVLRPEDVLVSARSTVVKAALVPSSIARAIADATLLVVRAEEPDLGNYLWWFLTSTFGRRRVLGQMKGSTTLLFLSAASLAEIELPLPEAAELYRIADLVEVSERAYATATEAAQRRRAVFREVVIDRLRHTANDEEVSAWR